MKFAFQWPIKKKQEMSKKTPRDDSVSMATSSMAFSVDIGDTSIDPALVRQRENRIIYFSDQITEQQRYYDMSVSELEIQQQMNQKQHQSLILRQQMLDEKKKQLEELTKQLKEAEAAHDGVVAKKKTLLSQINRIHQTIKTTFDRIDRHVKRHSTVLESDSEYEDEEDDGEAAAKANEKFKLMQNIKILKRKIVAKKVEFTKEAVSKLMLKVQKCELNNSISSLNETLDSLKHRFTECDKRIEVANQASAAPITPLTVDQDLTNQAEQFADEAERSFNRSRLEFASMETQLEYMQFKALKKQNKTRSANIKMRRAKLEKSKKRREIRLKHAANKAFATPSPQKPPPSFLASDRRNRSVSPVRNGQGVPRLRARSRISRIERRQIKIEIENNNLDDLEETNREYRERKELEYRQKIAKINELNNLIAERAILKNQVCESLSRNAMEKCEAEELSNKIEKIKNDKEENYNKCQQLMRELKSFDKNEALKDRQIQLDRKLAHIGTKRSRVEDIKRSVDKIEERFNKQLERVQSYDQRIEETGQKIEQDVREVKQQVETMLNGVDMVV